VLFMWGYSRGDRAKLVAFDHSAQNLLFSQDIGDSATISGELEIGTDGIYVTVFNFNTNQQSQIFKLGYLLSEEASEEDGKVQVYPNPTTGKVQLELPKSGDWELQIYDLLGRTLAQRQLPQGQRSLDLNGLPNGRLFLRLTNSKGEQISTSVLHLRD